MSRKVYVIQKPRDGHQFDLTALEKLGEVEYVLPSPPNMHDQARIKSDIAKMCKVVREAHPSDCFVALGGAPVSFMIFGVACATEGREIQLGMFSRGQDGDGRRLATGGSYRLVPINLAA